MTGPRASNPGNPRKANGHRRRQLRARVLAAYDTCWICGKPVDKTLKPLDPMSAEVDEIIPVSRGGSPYEWTNVRLAHRICNELKSNHSVDYARRKLGMCHDKTRMSRKEFHSEW